MLLLCKLLRVTEDYWAEEIRDLQLTVAILGPVPLEEGELQAERTGWRQRKRDSGFTKA